MVCLRFEPGIAGWKAQMNPLSYFISILVPTYMRRKGILGI